MENPEGSRGGEGNKIISYLPKRILSFTWIAPSDFPEVRNHAHKSWVVVLFESEDKGRTKVELHHLGWPEGEQWDEVYEYFDKAWDTVLKWP